jgi:hypothetical protein
MAARAVFDVMTAAMVVFSRLALNGSDWMTRTGRRLAGLLPRFAEIGPADGAAVGHQSSWLAR